jgi:hypothetical protein
MRTPLLGCAVFLCVVSTSLWGASQSLWQGPEQCGTSRQHAIELEQKLTKQPGDEKSRKELIRFHLCQANLDRRSANPGAYVRHLLWFIEHSPKSHLLGDVEGLADPGYVPWMTPEGFSQVREAWKRVIAENPTDDVILAHAAHAVSYSDKASAIEWLTRAVALDAGGNQDHASDLGWELAVALLGIEVVENGIFYAGSEYMNARTIVDQSTNAEVVYQAGGTLASYAPRVKNLGRPIGEYVALGQAWQARARAMDPSNIEFDDGPGEFSDEVRAAYPAYEQRLKATGMPSFEAFPAENIYDGKPAQPVLEPDDDPDSRESQAVLETANSKPDFAGHYTFALWSCGTSCFGAALVDARTGDVFDTPFLGFSYGYVYRVGIQDTFEPLQYRLDSRLIIATGCPQERRCGTRAYEWDGKRFHLLKEVLIIPAQ